MKPSRLVLPFILCASLSAQWVMVVNNTFLGAPNNSSVALLNRSDGSLVNKNWIVPAMGAGNWNGNCSAQDAVQVGSQVWIGSSKPTSFGATRFGPPTAQPASSTGSVPISVGSGDVK